jgi:uncharacterized protein (DUF58 family)
LSEPLLSPALLAALRDLELPRRRRVRRGRRGAYEGTRRGGDDEFLQHRLYVMGDDLRHIDWRATARTAHLLVKERHAPANRPLLLVLDATASMDYGPKLTLARTLAAALAFLALRHGDSVDLRVLNEEGLHLLVRVKPGLRSLRAVLHALERFQPGGRRDMGEELAGKAADFPRGAAIVVLSDCYGDAGALTNALERLSLAGAEVSLLHILTREEIELPASVPALLDAETGRRTSLSEEARAAHRSSVAAFRAALAARAAESGVDLRAVAAERPAIETLRAWLGR